MTDTTTDENTAPAATGQSPQRAGARPGSTEGRSDSIPAYVLPANATDEGIEAGERIVHQIIANDHKADLTDAQRARGIQQILPASRPRSR